MRTGKRVAIVTVANGAQKASVDVRLHGETFWLTQQIADLFGAPRSTPAEHIMIMKDGELTTEATCRNVRQVARRNEERRPPESNPEACGNRSSLFRFLVR